MENGYIKLYRSFRDWYGYKSHKRLALWVELLFCASHKTKDCLFGGKFLTLTPGQFVTGRKLLSSATGISETYVEKILDEFESIGQVRQQKCSTSRLITIVKWVEYQDRDSGKTAERQQKDNGETAERHNQECKNGKKGRIKNKDIPPNFKPPTLEAIIEYCNSRSSTVDPQKFFDHYTANGWMVGKNKMKDWKAAVRTWEHRDKDKSKIPTGVETLTEAQKRNIGRMKDFMEGKSVL